MPPPSAQSPLRDVDVVGGHGGILGDGEHVYKPLQTGRRGRAEAYFYELVCDRSRRERPPAVFMPRFYGIEEHREPRGGDVSAFIVLEDVTRGFTAPALMDIKMGQQAWDEDAPPAKVEQERSKYPTQQVVGFRFTGMRVPQPGAIAGGAVAGAAASDAAALSAPVKERGRAYGYSLTEATLGDAFAEYLHDGERVRVELIPLFLERLRAVRAWFAAQSEFRFYGSSLLFLYDAAPGAPPHVDVRMIDFAHVWPIPPAEARAADGGGARDAGYMLGLDRVIGYLEAVQRLHSDAENRRARP